MSKNRTRLALSLIILSLTGLQLSTLEGKASVEAGQKGAQVYCFMRSNGNDHEVSWKAAYALIKRQANSLFKTSPKHGAVMITEAVVKGPNKFPNCGRFLGDLFASEASISNDKNSQKDKNEKSGRYSY